MSLPPFQQPSSGVGSMSYEGEITSNEMVIKKKEKLNMEGQPNRKWSNQSSSPPLSARSCSTTMAVPHWLLSTLSDLEERMKVIATTNPEEEGIVDDSFAARAETYYQKRPLLLALLQDLYKSYINLSDRYIQMLSKRNNHTRHSSLVSSAATSDHGSYEVDKEDDVNWMGQQALDFSDVESTLSYQNPLAMTSLNYSFLISDVFVAELVMKNVECDILVHEIAMAERRSGDSSRKIELQKSLLEVLESERLILLNENSRLGYRVQALVQENAELASESVFMKRKASELARCVLKMREDQRVCMLSRKIEDLQGQIHGLEKRNKDYYEQLVKRDQNLEEYKKMKMKMKNNYGTNEEEASLGDCFQMGKLRWKREGNNNGSEGKTGGNYWTKVSCLWDRVKNMDMFLCGMRTDSP